MMQCRVSNDNERLIYVGGMMAYLSEYDFANI